MKINPRRIQFDIRKNEIPSRTRMKAQNNLKVYQSTFQEFQFDSLVSDYIGEL